MVNKHKYIEPSILLKLCDLNEDDALDLQTLVYQFPRIELIYFALEWIYNRDLSIGYVNFCKRISPQDDGKLLIEHICKHINNKSILANYHLVCAQTGLELLKYLFSIPDKSSPTNYSSLENGGIIKSIYILLIVLHINERIVNGRAPISDDDNAEDIIAHAAVISTIENNDFLNYDVTTTPYIHLYKASKFLDFCDGNSYFAKHKASLLSMYGCANSKTYLSFVIWLLLENWKYEDGYCRLVFDDDNPVPQAIDRISIPICEVISIDSNSDYKAFRKRPLIKLDNTHYVVICVPFLMDKLYNSLIFDLSGVSAEGNITRTKASSEFTEPLLLYPLLRSIVEPKSPIHLSGDDCKKIEPKRAPDYYVRNWNDVFLFELKDYSFRADIKSNPTFDELVEYLNTQFVTKTNGNDGAIKQLVHNIKSIVNNDFAWDKTLHNPRRIYPILILGNSTYMTLGMPYMINKLFRKELHKEGVSDCRISDLVVIDIDTLILYKGVFSSRKYKFKKVIDEYLKYINRDYSKSKNIELRLYAFMQTLPMFLRKYFPTTADFLVNELSGLDIWKN